MTRWEMEPLTTSALDLKFLCSTCHFTSSYVALLMAISFSGLSSLPRALQIHYLVCAFSKLWKNRWSGNFPFYHNLETLRRAADAFCKRMQVAIWWWSLSKSMSSFVTHSRKNTPKSTVDNNVVKLYWALHSSTQAKMESNHSFSEASVMALFVTYIHKVFPPRKYPSLLYWYFCMYIW